MGAPASPKNIRTLAQKVPKKKPQRNLPFTANFENFVRRTNPPSGKTENYSKKWWNTTHHFNCYQFWKLPNQKKNRKIKNTREKFEMKTAWSFRFFNPNFENLSLHFLLGKIRSDTYEPIIRRTATIFRFLVRFSATVSVFESKICNKKEVLIKLKFLVSFSVILPTVEKNNFSKIFGWNSNHILMKFW